MCLIVFFFFKQKTAYEMRISDWSSDVCSSDLRLQVVEVAVEDAKIEIQAVIEPLALDAGLPRFDVLRLEHEVGAIERCGVEAAALVAACVGRIQRDVLDPEILQRSEERRVGKEWVSTGRYRW